MQGLGLLDFQCFGSSIHGGGVRGLGFRISGLMLVFGFRGWCLGLGCEVLVAGFRTEGFRAWGLRAGGLRCIGPKP